MTYVVMSMRMLTRIPALSAASRLIQRIGHYSIDLQKNGKKQTPMLNTEVGGPSNGFRS